MIVESPPAAEPLPALPAEMAGEIATYWRELPRLLAEGETGRYALIQGDEVISTWDTFRDARQAGYDRFGLDKRFITQCIDPRDTVRLAPYFPTPAPSATCPS